MFIISGRVYIMIDFDRFGTYITKWTSLQSSFVQNYLWAGVRDDSCIQNQPWELINYYIKRQCSRASGI